MCFYLLQDMYVKVKKNNYAESSMEQSPLHLASGELLEVMNISHPQYSNTGD